MARGCAIDGCAEPAHLSSLCRTHYWNQEVHGSPLGPPRRHPECSVDGCTKEAEAARGLCHKHYRRLLMYGSPTGLPESKRRSANA